MIGRSPAEVQPVRDDVIQQHFDPVNDTPKLNFTNPTRRDATMLPGKGWLIVAFRNDNPGAWLFHCHIAVRERLLAPNHEARYADQINAVARQSRLERTVPRKGRRNPQDGLELCRRQLQGMARLHRDQTPLASEERLRYLMGVEDVVSSLTNRLLII